METAKGKVTKWVGLAAGIWVQALAGNGNVFPHYAPTLKHQLHINQVQLNNLGVAKDFGESVGLIAGMLSNLIPPWTILLMGALEGFLAYGTLWLVMSGHIAPLPYWQMCVVLLIGANSTTCYNTAVLVTTMRNFPESRGMVVGIVKGFVGLSSAIFTQFYVAILRDNATDLVLLLAMGPFVVCLLVMYFIQPVGNSGEKKAADPDERSGFAFIHIVCIGLAGYLFVATLFETLVTDISPLMYQIIIALMLVFLFSPLVVPTKFAYERYFVYREKRKSINSSWDAPQLSSKTAHDLREPLLNAENAEEQQSNESKTTLLLVEDEEQDTESQQETKFLSSGPGESTSPQDFRPNLDRNNSDLSPRTSDASYSDDNSQSTMSKNSDRSREDKSNRGCLSVPQLYDGEVDAGTLLAVGEGAVRRRVRKGPRRGEDFTLAQALVKADFWLLFFTYFCGMGTGTTVVNNLGQIGQAQGYSDVTMFVSLFGIMNFLGRLGGGALSEHFVKAYALPRTVWMVVAQVVMIMGHLLFATALPGSLYVGSVVLGGCYGMHVAIVVPTASELFGLQHFGIIYNFVTMAVPVGSLLLSGIVAGYLYDRESDNSPSVNYNVEEHISARYMRNYVVSHSDKAACLGAHCFQLTFIIMAMVLVVGVILNLILTYRIRRVYRSLYGSQNPSYQNLAAAGGNESSPASPAAQRSPGPSTPRMAIVKKPS